ncbi:MAG: HPP family protein [Oceanospirillaceae bacterium]|nr:HPP family protein [Oceanospirillaceae bacterium]
MVLGSMGATAVLLFAVPHGALSQPWAVVGGHLLSALIGVSCARLIGPPELAAATAVAASTAVMYYLHCIHPPGGATAMVAVLGGDAIRELGYSFVLVPVAANLMILMFIAVALNWPFRHRRYPAILSPAADRKISDSRPELTHMDLSYALAEIDSFIDVSEQDLLRLYSLARQHQAKGPVAKEQQAANDAEASPRRRAGGND